MWIIILLVASYLIGSIPTSIIIGRALKGIDIREHGSGNPGATNTFRVFGKKIGITVGLIDILKGFFPVFFLAPLMYHEGILTIELAKISAGIAAVAGHMWTVFAGFKGGKGVSTSFGVILGLFPLPALIAAVVWCVVTFGTGYVSLGSITGALVLPLSVVISGIVTGGISWEFTGIAVLLGTVVIYRHKQNVTRLLNGEENRFGKRGKK